MAVTLVNSNSVQSSNNGTTGTITLPTVTSGNSLVLTIAILGSTKTLTGIVDSAGGQWTLARRDTGLYVGEIETWYVGTHPGSASTLTVTVTFSTSGSNYMPAVIGQFSGPIASVRSGAIADSGSGGATVASQSITVTSQAGDLIVACQSRSDDAISGEGPISPAALIGAGTTISASNTSGWLAASSTSSTIAFASTGATQMGTQGVAFSMGTDTPITVAWLTV